MIILKKKKNATEEKWDDKESSKWRNNQLIKIILTLDYFKLIGFNFDIYSCNSKFITQF